MSTDLVNRFVDILTGVGVDATRTDRAGATDAIAAAVEGETVATPLPFADVSLPDGVRTDPTRADLERARTGVTPATLGVASHGSVVVTPTEDGEGSVSLFPPRYVAVLDAADLVPDLGTALARLGRAFAAGDDDAVFVTGPSSTADMGELVEGVHGPSEVHVVIFE